MTNNEFIFCVHYHHYCVVKREPISNYYRFFTDLLFDKYYQNPPLKVFKQKYREFGEEALRILNDNIEFAQKKLVEAGGVLEVDAENADDALEEFDFGEASEDADYRLKYATYIETQELDDNDEVVYRYMFRKYKSIL